MERPIAAPGWGRQHGDRTSVVEIYIYDDFAWSFQRSRAILSIWTKNVGHRPPTLAMIGAMSERRQRDVIGSLPSTRPSRRSGKRPPASENAETRATPDGAEPETTRAATPEPARAAAKPDLGARRATAKPEPGAPRATAKPKAKPAGTGPRRARPAAARTHAAERPRPRTPGAKPPPAARAPEPVSGALQTAVDAFAELTEIGLRLGARTLRTALSRLPRP